LILAARRRDRLESLRADLLASAREILVVEADLSTPSGLAHLIDELDALGEPVDLVVNNAGFGIGDSFLQTSPEKLDELIALNVGALTRLTRWAAERMTRKGHGYLHNIATTAAFQPLPYMAAYSATKAYVSSLSLALHEELHETGVFVSCLHPGRTETEFFVVGGFDENTPFMKMGTMGPSEVVTQGIEGVLRNRALVVPGWINRLMFRAGHCMPLRWKLVLARHLLRST
jgi:short-subunit dehydrogenase